ncbi:unnamed protein product [Urochloa humidicola]
MVTCRKGVRLRPVRGPNRPPWRTGESPAATGRQIYSGDLQEAAQSPRRGTGRATDVTDGGMAAPSSSPGQMRGGGTGTAGWYATWGGGGVTTTG